MPLKDERIFSFVYNCYYSPLEKNLILRPGYCIVVRRWRRILVESTPFVETAKNGIFRIDCSRPLPTTTLDYFSPFSIQVSKVKAEDTYSGLTSRTLMSANNITFIFDIDAFVVA